MTKREAKIEKMKAEGWEFIKYSNMVINGKNYAQAIMYKDNQKMTISHRGMVNIFDYN